MNDHLDELDDLLRGLPPLRPLPASVAVRGRRRRRLKVGALSGAGALAVAGVLLLAPGGQVDRVSPPPAAPSPSVSTSPSPSASAVVAVVVLRPDGLGVSSGTTTRALPFGTAVAEVEQALTPVLGPGTSGTNDAGGFLQFGRLALTITDGTLAGWSTDDGAVRTADGVGVGTTLAELRSALPAVVLSTGSVGVEWAAGEDLAGTLDGDDPTSVVTSLRAGATLVAR